MKIITDIAAISTLRLSKSIEEALLLHLVEPFDGSIDATSEFWQTVQTSLIVIEPDDNEAVFTGESATLELFEYVAEYPEFVVLIDSDTSPFILALGINSSTGGGCYVLAPIDSPLKQIKTLTENI